MKRRKTGRKTAKARVKASRRNAPKGARIRIAVGKDTATAQLARERDEALQQQAATAEILKLISSSPADTQPVFEAIVRNGLKLFPDAAIFIALPHGNELRAAAFVATDPNREKMWARQWPIPLTREYMHSLAFLDRKTVDIPDARDAPPELAVGAKNFLPTGYRALTIMPMMRGRTAIGTLSVVRLAPGKLSARQKAALKTYAAQAVIAIENTRVLNELRQRTDDLSESLEQQTATSEVLQVISKSPGELEPVFEAMLENAVRICGAKFGTLFRYDGDVVHLAAQFGTPPALTEFQRKRGPFRPETTGTGILGRVIRTKAVLHSADSAADPNPGVATTLGGARSIVGVPMFRDDALVGAIVIYRQEVRPFTGKQIELVQNFAAQAVIAIENTRLLNELRESLEQQTATSDVLKVISSSPGELQPVFDAMLANATKICGAEFGLLYRSEDEAFRTVALYGVPPRFAKERRLNPILRPSSGTALGRVVATRQLVQIADVRAEPGYQNDPLRRASFLELAGARTVLCVPMLKEGEVVGAISIYRQEVRPFTDKQIALLANFAAQAVIAIENTRLLSELRESLQQQTATADVLKVISRSTFDLQTVLDTLVESAARLCGAEMANIWRPKDGSYRLTASYGVTARYKEYLENKEFLNTIVIEPGRGTMVGRVLLERRTVHIHDIQADPDYKLSGLVDLGGYRTMLGVPILRAGEPIGVFVLVQSEVRPFTDKQIDLATTFSDQAAIAIENVRLFDEVQTRTRDLSESLEQQTATSEVLKVISSSPGELQQVFQVMLENATRICEAKIGILFRYEGGAFTAIAMLGVAPAYAEYLNSGAIRPGPTTGLGRLAVSKQTIHVLDTQAEAAYAEQEPLRVATAKLGGARSLLNVPMIKDGELIGAVGIYRQQVRPFTDKQIELVTNFASQAVIAIENTRLLNELRQRTDDLSESLEQQTATSEVLKVISSSPGELEPVFNSILANATHLCEATFGNLFLCEGLVFRAVAVHGKESYVDYWRRDPVVDLREDPGVPLERAVKSKQVVHIPDLRIDPSYTERNARIVALVEIAGARSFVMVPMLKEGEIIGTVAMYRQEVRPFTEKQIELLKNFAAQAVIAIENTRLLSELRESLQQQTATADVLKVISRSTFDLDAVLDSLVESAVKVCEADTGIIRRRDGDRYPLATTFGFTAEQRDNFVRYSTAPGRGSVFGRAILEGRTIHVPDLLADHELDQGRLKDYAGTLNIRSALGVPLMRQGAIVGVFTLQRRESRPFTDKQIELVETFADQAVIAIENTRLLNELRLLTELRESLQQQTATADVLKVISSSPGELEPVFQEMLSNAMQICEAKFGILLEFADGAFRALSSFNLPPAFAEYHNEARVWGPETGLGKLVATKKTVHITDARDGRAFAERDAGRVAAVELGGVRTFVAVPMLKEDELIGAFIVFRQEVRPFTDKQIELVSNFAAQAVIAIENARLLSELRESLQQQTATADVLKVISSSRGEVVPVFEALLENAVRICEAGFANLWLHDGKDFRAAAIHGAPPEYRDLLQKAINVRPGAGTPLAGVIETKRAAQMPDMSVSEAYRRGDPVVVASVDIAGTRSLVCVPMLKENELVGAIAIYRQEVRPFTDKQIELVSNFAAQAVIAIENARLLNELRESLQQQTATADVLTVISSSPGTLDPVFSTMLAKATELCEASYSTLWLHEGDGFRTAAIHGDLPPAWIEQWRSGAIYRPGPDGRWRALPRSAGRSRLQICAPTRRTCKATRCRSPASKSPAFVPCLSFRCSRKANLSARSPSTVRRCSRLPRSRSSWCKISPRRPSSPSRTHVCSTSCVNRCSSRPRPPMSSRSSAARPSTCRRCCKLSLNRPRGSAMPTGQLSPARRTESFTAPKRTVFLRNSWTMSEIFQSPPNAARRLAARCLKGARFIYPTSQTMQSILCWKDRSWVTIERSSPSRCCARMS